MIAEIPVPVAPELKFTGVATAMEKSPTCTVPTVK